MKLENIISISVFILFLSFFTCSDNSGSSSSKEVVHESMEEDVIDLMREKGIGPVSTVDVSGEVDQAMVEEGKKIYEAKCIACHNIDKKMIGPPQKGILKRRSPEWIMNMILNPEEMIKKDPVAKKLLAEYNNIPMTNQQLTRVEARQILEFFRTIN